jgi:predicted branched-subunit amino acid permease
MEAEPVRRKGPVVLNIVCLLIFAGVIAGVQAALRGLGWSEAITLLAAIVAGAVVFGSFLVSGLLDNNWGKQSQGPEER